MSPVKRYIGAILVAWPIATMIVYFIAASIDHDPDFVTILFVSVVCIMVACLIAFEVQIPGVRRHR